MAFSSLKRSIFCIFAIPLIATQTFDPFEVDTLNVFYDLFVCDEKNIVETVDLSKGCSGVSARFPNNGENILTPCGLLLSPPSIPSVPPNSNLTFLPFLLENNTGQPDSEVFFLIYGEPVVDGSVEAQQFVSFGTGSFTNQYGTPASGDGSSLSYSYSIQDVKNFTGGQALIYVPYLQSGIMLYSIANPLSLTSSAGSIAIPPPTDTGDTNYNTVYAGMEVTFYPPNFVSPISGTVQNQVTVDFTCVDYFGFPIYFNLFTNVPAPGIPNNRPSGIYQSRHYILCSLQNAFQQAVGNAATQWNSLVLTNGSTILRIVSPGYAMTHAGGTFDANYFNNAASYGYSWANDVWNGPSPYYGSNQLAVTVGGGYGTVTYTASVTDSVFIFSTALFGNEQFNVPWINAASTPDVGITGTTAGIMNVKAFMPGMTYQSNTQTTPISLSSVTDGGVIDRATKITEYFSASISVGLLPGKVQYMSSSGYPLPVTAAYNTPNLYLNPPGPSTGPWYDLYSLGLLGNTQQDGNAVYAYAYDDYLYANNPALQVAPSQTSMDPTTYITVFLGPYTAN